MAVGITVAGTGDMALGTDMASTAVVAGVMGVVIAGAISARTVGAGEALASAGACGVTAAKEQSRKRVGLGLGSSSPRPFLER